jgi:hypothetical protein
MKSLLNGLYILGLAVFILGLNGCKTNSSLNCPDLANVRKTQSPSLVFNHHKSHQAETPKPAGQAVNTGAGQSTPVLASPAPEMAFKIKMPNSLNTQLQNDKELDDMNKLLADYSNNKVALQRNDKGKLFLKAHSIKDIFALAKNTAHPRGYYERRYGNGGDGGGNAGAAIASSVLGPISFIFAFIPFLSFAAIPISIAAIITGGIGLRSHRQRLAAVGLTFAILGLIFSILMSILYLHVFFAIWLI